MPHKARHSVATESVPFCLETQTKKQNVFLIVIPMLKKETYMDWICRALMSFDLFAICAGYISYFQAKRQLVSPLIPRSAMFEVAYQTNELYIRASLITAGLFLTGVWFYSFRKKVIAATLFLVAIIVYRVVLSMA